MSYPHDPQAGLAILSHFPTLAAQTEAMADRLGIEASRLTAERDGVFSLDGWDAVFFLGEDQAERWIADMDFPETPKLREITAPGGPVLTVHFACEECSECGEDTAEGLHRNPDDQARTDWLCGRTDCHAAAQAGLEEPGIESNRLCGAQLGVGRFA